MSVSLIHRPAPVNGASPAGRATAAKRTLARIASILFRRRYPEGALSPCCQEWLVQDPRQPDRVVCSECGGLNRKAA
jgi:hypothetical protein